MVSRWPLPTLKEIENSEETSTGDVKLKKSDENGENHENDEDGIHKFNNYNKDDDCYFYGTLFAIDTWSHFNIYKTPILCCNVIDLNYVAMSQRCLNIETRSCV